MCIACRLTRSYSRLCHIMSSVYRNHMNMDFEAEGRRVEVQRLPPAKHRKPFEMRDFSGQTREHVSYMKMWGETILLTFKQGRLVRRPWSELHEFLSHATRLFLSKKLHISEDFGGTAARNEWCSMKATSSCRGICGNSTHLQMEMDAISWIIPCYQGYIEKRSRWSLNSCPSLNYYEKFRMPSSRSISI